MRHWLRRVLTAAIGTMIVTTALVAPASTASAASTCNSWTTKFADDGYRFEIPSIGRNSNLLNCVLRLYDGYNGGGVQSAVFVLQGSLNRCNGANLTQDGKYGPRTRDVVAWVTAAEGLPQPPEGFGAYTQVAAFFAIRWLGQRTVGGETRAVCRYLGTV
jgi:peptidoglycan hydrolase-like protein with peptidoglycan-binding domain